MSVTDQPPSGSVFAPDDDHSGLPPVIHYTLVDRDTAHAVRILAWTITYLLWLVAATVVLFLVLLAVAVVNGSLPG